MQVRPILGFESTKSMGTSRVTGHLPMRWNSDSANNNCSTVGLWNLNSCDNALQSHHAALPLRAACEEWR